jgi:hypothetical protein
MKVEGEGGWRGWGVGSGGAERDSREWDEGGGQLGNNYRQCIQTFSSETKMRELHLSCKMDKGYGDDVLN